jgi:TRAP-type C4-dicarboxylate transport system substrate-binding protein
MKTSAVAIAAIAITLCAVPADAQVQERTIRWGHLNNTDHPVSLGVQKFAEILAAMCGRLRVGKDFLHVCSIGRCSHVFGL